MTFFEALQKIKTMDTPERWCIQTKEVPNFCWTIRENYIFTVDLVDFVTTKQEGRRYQMYPVGSDRINDDRDVYCIVNLDFAICTTAEHLGYSIELTLPKECIE